MTKIERRACAFLLAGFMSFSVTAASFPEKAHAEEGISAKMQENALLGMEPEMQDIQEGADEALADLELPSEESEQGMVSEEDKLQGQLQENVEEGKAEVKPEKKTAMTDEDYNDYEDEDYDDEDYDDGDVEEEVKDEKVGNWYYRVVSEESKTAVITGYSGTDSIVSIPGELTVQTGAGAVKYKVIEIGGTAFYYDRDLTEVTIPNTVTTIQYNSFRACNSLKKVSFETGSALKTIESHAFEDTGALESFSCPEGVETIGSEAFYKSGLRSVKIPNKMKVIQSAAFARCSLLTSVTLGTSVLEIGEGAFAATGLTAVVIPDSVTAVKSGAFRGCKNLTDVKFGNGITFIDGSAFAESGVKNINFGNKVKIVGDYAFTKNESLTKLVIPSNVTEMQYKTFADCTNLVSIALPDTIERLSGENFIGTVWYESQPEGEVYLGKVFYHYKGKITEGTTLKVRDGTRCIAGFSCAQQENLKSVELPDGLINIGYAAFLETGLKSIRIPASVTQIDDGAIGYIRGEGTVFKYIDPTPNPDIRHQADSEFIIYGYSGTEAEAYAKRNNIQFSPLQWDINECSISGVESSYTYTGKDITPAVTVKAGSVVVPASNYTVSYENNRKVGTATITVTGKNSLSGKLTKTFTIKPEITLSKTEYSKIMGARSFKLNARVSGAAKLNYQSSNKKVVTVKNGTVSVKGTGKAVITVSVSENGVQVSRKIDITVKPAKMAKPSVRAKKKSMTVSWRKASSITGYEIQYSTNKKFTSGKTRTKVIKKASVKKKKIGGLKAKTYYVRIRACGRNSLKGSFSKAVKVKCK